MSRTLVFHYFPSKADFYAAVVASAGDRLMQDVRPGRTWTRGCAMVEAFLRSVQRKRGVYVALVRGASGGDPGAGGARRGPGRPCDPLAGRGAVAGP